MIPPDRVTTERQQAYGEFAVCETFTELVIAGYFVFGIQGVERTLAEARPSRERLREAAGQLVLVGLRDLAAVLRRHARQAKPGSTPIPWRERMTGRGR